MRYFSRPTPDCILYVVGAGYVDQETVRTTHSLLAASEPDVLACFVNRVPRECLPPSRYNTSWSRRMTSAASRRIVVLPPSHLAKLDAEPDANHAVVVTEAHSRRVTAEEDVNPDSRG